MTCCWCGICPGLQNIENQRPSSPELEHQTPDTWRIDQPRPHSHEKILWWQHHIENRRTCNWKLLWQGLFYTDIWILWWWPSRGDSRRPNQTIVTNTRDRGQLFEHVINVASQWHPWEGTSDRAQMWPQRIRLALNLPMTLPLWSHLRSVTRPLSRVPTRGNINSMFK